MKVRSFVRLAMIAAAISTFAAAEAETYAFLIGINDYPDVVDSAGNPIKDENGNIVDSDLKGCENDARSMLETLTKTYSVKPENAKILLSKDANATNFIENMKWLVQTPKEGDQVLFFYSGHGGQIKSETEADALDEVIVLADNQLVPDDFFGELAPLLSSKGIGATFVFDSCFSGGMARDPGVRFKSMELMKTGGHVRLAAEKMESVKMAPKQAPVTTPGVYAYLFAGQEDQPTIDISGLKDLPDHGLFTMFLLAALTDNPNMPLKELMDVIAKTISEELKFKQNPRFESSTADRGDGPILIRQ